MTANNQTQPSSTDENGRELSGRFSIGNKFAKGNPYAKKVAKFRSVLLSTISSQDMKEIMDSLVYRAKHGNIASAKLVLNYTVGQPQPFAHPDEIVPGFLTDVILRSAAEERRALMILIHLLEKNGANKNKVFDAVRKDEFKALDFSFLYEKGKEKQ